MPPQSRGSAPVPTAFPEHALSTAPAPADDYFTSQTLPDPVEYPAEGIDQWPSIDQDGFTPAQEWVNGADTKEKESGPGAGAGGEYRDNSLEDAVSEDEDDSSEESGSSESDNEHETAESKSTSTTSPPQRSASSDGNQDKLRKPAPKRPRMLPHTSSQLFPPFYNRPPTPLPPSPSLTSLLRPSFSAHSSRPSTPDTSDAESVARGRRALREDGSPANNFRATGSTAPQPRSSIAPKIPTYEYYGFALYLFSTLSFIVYLLWAALPAPLLHRLGIWYYPNRWWALAIPAWIVMFLIYIYVALASWNTGYLTPKVGDLGSIVDTAGQIAIVDEEGRIIRKKRKLGNDGSKEALSKSHSAGGSSSRKSHGKDRSLRGKKRKAHREDALTATTGQNSLTAPSPSTSRKSGRRASPSPGGPGQTDSSPQPANLLGKDVDWRKLWSEGTDAVMDVPIGGVCEVLYGLGREDG